MNWTTVDKAKLYELAKNLAQLLGQADHDGLPINQRQKEGATMPRPLKYGQGSITKRKRTNKNGSIYEWVQARYLDEHGRRCTITCKSDKEAREMLKQYKASAQRNYKRKKVVTFGQYLQEWFDNGRRDSLSEDHRRKSQKRIDCVPKELKARPLTQIDVPSVQRYLNTLDGIKSKPETKAFLGSCLKQAFNEGILKVNVGALLKADSYKAKERNILELKDEQRFLDLLPQAYRAQAIGLIYTGCRISEFMRIKAEDVDRENKTIKIRQTKSIRANDRKQGIFHSIRIIPLLPPAELLEFPLKKIRENSFRKAFREASEVIGIKLTPHDMRHTFATRCDDLGIKEKVIMSMLGQKDRQVTKRYKDHKTKDLLEAEFDKIRASTPVSTPLGTK